MVRKLLPWIESTRPLSCAFGFFLSLASWAIAYHTISWLAVFSSIECYWYMAATMVMNAWFDRYHDVKKPIPVDFVLKNEKSYRRFTIACWLIEIIFIVCLFSINSGLGILAIARSLIGFFYGWTRKVTLAARNRRCR